MRLVRWGVVLFCFAWPGLAGLSAEAQRRGHHRVPAREPPVNMAPLIAGLLRSQPQLETEPHLGSRLHRNLTWVRRHRLNDRRLLVEPSGQQVADRLEELVQLNEKISQLLRQLRQQLANRRGSVGFTAELEVIREIEKASGELKSRFSGFFVEPGPHSIELALPTDPRPQSCLVYFLLSAEDLQRRQTSELLRFIYGSEPGRVSVQQLQRDSIPVLAKALRLLSQRTRQLLESAVASR